MADQQGCTVSVPYKPTKSKLKRLNRRAKASRVESELKRERNLSASAKKLCDNWRGKALEYRIGVSINGYYNN